MHYPQANDIFGVVFMMELNSYINSYTNSSARAGYGEAGQRSSWAQGGKIQNSLPGLAAHGLSFGEYGSSSSGLGQSELDISGTRRDLQNSMNDGLVVDLVRTLTRSLTSVIDLVQGVFLGDGANANTPGISPTLKDSSVGDGRAGSSQGLFGTLGSIVGGVFDKIGMHLPILGGRVF